MLENLEPEKVIFGSKITQLTSDGSSVAIVASKSLLEGKSTMNIYLHEPSQFSCSQLTRDDFGSKASSPVFISTSEFTDNPDHLLFLRNGKLWALPLSGGESYILWDEVREMQGFKVCGEKEKFIVAEFSLPTTSENRHITSKSGTVLSSATGKVYKNLFVRYWNEWCNIDEHNHLVAASITLTGEGCLAVQKPSFDLMAGLKVHCPGKGPGYGPEDYAISSDGRYIAIVAKKFDPVTLEHYTDKAWQTDVPVYLSDLRSVDLTLTPSDDGYKALKFTQITSEDLHSVHSNPVFSPTSDKIAFLSMARAGYESDRLEVKVYHIQEQVTQSITGHLDISFASLLWPQQQPHVLYATAQYRASNRIFRIELDMQDQNLVSIQVMIGDESRSAVNFVEADGEYYLYYLESTILSPHQVKRVNLKEAKSIFVDFDINCYECKEVAAVESMEASLSYTIMNANPQFENGDVLLPQLSQHYFKGADGDYVQCWYLSPSRLEEEEDLQSHSVPLLCIVHGGPQGAFLNAWSLRWNLGAFAAQGYAVVAINFHGSTSFGTTFQDSINNNWGGRPFEDIMLGLDFILNKYSYIDPKRVAALGASYGGYMMNWINGQTDRFACLVNHAGIFSLRSEYFTTEELWFPEWDLGLPWENVESYARFSPDTYVDQWKTPTLVIHGAKDFRVPETEGIATFTTLQRKGVPSEFLYFPDEGHWINKPQNSLQWYETIFRWLEKWLRS